MFLKKSQYITAGMLVGTLLLPHTLFSQMGSTNYQIQFDSINFAGGTSSSSSYQLEDTAGEIASGDSSSTNFQMRAGYQQMNGGYIAISGQSLVDLGSVGGISTNNAVTDTPVNVMTDSYGGYQMTIRATSSPALTSGPYFFGDYTQAGAAPDFLFAVAPNDSEFGFSVSGPDVVQRYRNNGSACNAGSDTTAQRCWDGLTTSPVLVSQRYSSNHPLGTETIYHYQVGIGSNKVQEAGAYTGELIITATAL